MRTIQDNKDNRINRLNEINDGLREERDDLKEEVNRLNAKVISLEIKNRQLHRWVMNLSRSRQKLASSYSEDIRTLRAIEERYSNNYAQHIRNTPLPE
jgi:ABC-type transporter Mla subunit MlaD